MNVTDIGGTYVRVAEPGWPDPLDATFSVVHGGRWNAPGSYAVLYVNADLATARANVAANFAGLPYGPEDLDPLDAPHLIDVAIPHGSGCDVRTDDGLAAVGLPTTYPHDAAGALVDWSVCQPIGRDVHDRGLDGVACRSAAPGGREELAFFARPDGLVATPGHRREFPDWYWADPSADEPTTR